MEFSRLTCRVTKNYEIIEQMRRFPTIWDIRCMEYKDTQLKAKAFQTIAKEVGLTVAQIKEKYKNLRTYYIKEKKKVEIRKRTNPGDPYQSKWEFYEALDEFMGSNFRFKSSYSVLPEEGVADDDGGESSGDRSMYMEESERPDLSETGLWFKEEVNEESWDSTRDNLQEPISPSEAVSPSGSQSVNISPSPVQVSSSIPPLVHVSPLVPHHSHPSSSSPLHLCPSAQVLTPVAQNVQVSSSVPPAATSLQAVSLHMNDSLGHGVTRQVELIPTSSQSASQESTDSLFGQIVSRQLATLPEGKQKELLKLKIQRLIFQTKFEDETTESDSF